MRQLPTELEWKYINYSVELRKIKDGRYGRNIFFFILRTYLAVSLLIRLFRLKMDLKHGNISKRQYISYSRIIHLAI
jgi:hypothetical protein